MKNAGRSPVFFSKYTQDRPLLGGFPAQGGRDSSWPPASRLESFAVDPIELAAPPTFDEPDHERFRITLDMASVLAFPMHGRAKLGFAARVLAALITGYQRYLSPYKGFRCAHRVLHGGLSCSAFAKQVLLRRGVVEAFLRMRRRFVACAAAAAILHAVAAPTFDRDHERRRQEWSDDTAYVLNCCSSGCDPCTFASLVPGDCFSHGGAALACADPSACLHVAACIPF